MLVIRAAQIDSFQAGLLDALHGRVLADLHAARSSGVLHERQLSALAARSVAEARRLRLPRETHLRRFADILATYVGADIDRPLPPPALQILLSYGPTADARLDGFARWVAGQAADGSEATR